MFMQMVSSKVHPACHNIANGIKPGSNSKTTDKGCRVIYVRCINCSYNNVAKSIRLLDKNAIFVDPGELSCK